MFYFFGQIEEFIISIDSEVINLLYVVLLAAVRHFICDPGRKKAHVLPYAKFQTHFCIHTRIVNTWQLI